MGDPILKVVWPLTNGKSKEPLLDLNRFKNRYKWI